MEMTYKNAANYTGMGKKYKKYRSGYSEKVIDVLLNYIKLDKNSKVADIGAGTGIFTRQIAERGLECIAKEPWE